MGSLLLTIIHVNNVMATCTCKWGHLFKVGGGTAQQCMLLRSSSINVMITSSNMVTTNYNNNVTINIITTHSAYCVINTISTKISNNNGVNTNAGAIIISSNVRTFAGSCTYTQVQGLHLQGRCITTRGSKFTTDDSNTMTDIISKTIAGVISIINIISINVRGININSNIIIITNVGVNINIKSSVTRVITNKFTNNNLTNSNNFMWGQHPLQRSCRVQLQAAPGCRGQCHLHVVQGTAQQYLVALYCKVLCSSTVLQYQY